MQDRGHHETEDIMNAVTKLTVPMLVVGVLLVSAGFAGAQRTTLQGAVVGTWALVSEVAHQGEKTTLPLGPNPLGSIMLDGGGRFILMIARPDLPKFAANKRDAGTP
jgi:Lipocalin-like domain